MDSNKIIITEEYERCFDLIDSDTPVIFISGQAGTGKSVLIDQITERYRDEKRIVRTAPTGVTALNISGQTLHSLFKLPIGLLTIHTKLLSAVNKIRKQGLTELFENIDMMIVDEISMVRPDTLDAVDFILRSVRGVNYPFGGVQIIFVGDMFQLPPVITEEEREAFERTYGTDFFFGSKVVEEMFTMGCVEVVHLTKTFRQADPLFVNILNEIRVNKNTSKNVRILNEYCGSNVSWEPTDERSVILCTTNKRATQINNNELGKLDGITHRFDATIDGDFKTQLVTPEQLELKVGAKVMFTRNSPDGWVNGTIGVVEGFSGGDDGKSITVRIADSGMVVDVRREKWENIAYRVVKEEDENGRSRSKIVEQVLGYFEQFPLTLAYALTIHKVQGLTFDRVSLDLGTGSFAPGQTYVALSRCTSIDGLHLVRPINHNDVYVDERVVEFYDLLTDYE